MLPTGYLGYTIAWDSEKSEVLNEFGMFNRPYQEEVVELIAEIKINDVIFYKEFELPTVGYKKLDSNIMSSYVFLGFNNVSDDFYDYHEIVNVAFAVADSNINFNKVYYPNYFNDVSNYIIPKAKETGTWVIMSVAPESDWSAIASNPAKVDLFSDKIVELINTYGFDGVDIDWETPTSSESTLYTALMQKVYTKVKANNPHHLVTTAIAGGMWQVARYDLNNSLAYIDYINMMIYDMSRNNGQYQSPLYKRTGFDNPTANAGSTLTSASIEESVQLFNTTYGVPYSKMIIGMPFYGVRQTRTFNNGSWSNWTASGTILYHNILNNYLNNNEYTYYFDNVSKVPYLLKNDLTEFISYDNNESAYLKAEFVRMNNLAGVMYWQYGGDNTGTLIEALYNGLKL